MLLWMGWRLDWVNLGKMLYLPQKWFHNTAVTGANKSSQVQRKNGKWHTMTSKKLLSVKPCWLFIHTLPQLSCTGPRSLRFLLTSLMIGINQWMRVILGRRRLWRHQSTYMPSLSVLINDCEGTYIDWWRWECHHLSMAVIDYWVWQSWEIYKILFGSVTSLVGMCNIIKFRLYYLYQVVGFRARGLK